MIHARGITAWLQTIPGDTHERSSLFVTRGEETPFTIDTDYKLGGRLLYWGSSTKRFLLATNDERFEPPGLFVFDLKKRKCNHLCCLPSRQYMSERSIKSVTCSGSGRTIAAYVEEADLLASIYVLSVDKRRQFVYSTRTFACEFPDVLCEKALPCFMGPIATELVAVNMFSGDVFRLGHEDSCGVMHFESSMTRTGTVFPDEEDVQDMEVQAVAHVQGSSTLLALAVQADGDSVWGVFEMCNARPRVLVPKSKGGPMEDIAQTPGVGVTVFECRVSHAVVFPELHS